MSMSRREHYRRAQELIGDLDQRVRPDRQAPVMTEVDRERLGLASVHATLAGVPADVAEEGYRPEDLAGFVRTGQVAPIPSPEDPSGQWVSVARLEEALRDLEALGDTLQESRRVADYIRRRVLGAGSNQ